MTDEQLARELCPDAHDVGRRAVEKMGAAEKFRLHQLIKTGKALAARERKPWETDAPRAQVRFG